MSHFTSEGWCDFARGVAPAEQRALMQRHIEDGCDQCLKISEIWRMVSEITRREISYSPPVTAVVLVKAAYLAEHTWGWLPRVARMARLIFDSSIQPAPATVRSAMAAGRQFLHEAEPYVIDLRVESEAARKRVWLIGQVLNSKEPEAGMDGVEVVLLSGERFVAKTEANSSGEFEFELGDEKGLQLFINIRGNRAIGIALPDSEI
jgi:hypothetical protein